MGASGRKWNQMYIHMYLGILNKQIKSFQLLIIVMYYYIQCGSTSKDAVILHYHVSTVAHNMDKLGFRDFILMSQLV